MSVNQAGSELMKVLQMRGKDPNEINKRLDEVYRRFGSENIERWRNMSNKKNTFLHELVEAKIIDTIRYVVTDYRFPVNTERNDDKLTAYGLAKEKGYTGICEAMNELGAKEIETVDVSLWSEEQEKERSLNMVWIDLEMTEIENPKILECAVIITDKDLTVLDRSQWVIHYEKKELDELSQWHQDHFGDPTNGKGGNNLFADCIRTKNTTEYVENELLKLLKRNCPDGKCSLAGSSIHTDQNVLKICMPKVHAYLHYRIIDVTTIQSVMRRWAPEAESRIKKQLVRQGQGIVNHRAMQDIEYSISFMREFRSLMINAANSGQRGAHGGSHAHNRGNFRGNHHNSPRQRGDARNVARHRNSEPNEDDNIPQVVRGFAAMDLYKDEKQLIERLRIDRDIDNNSFGLKDDELKIYDENPHLREIFLNRLDFQCFNGKAFTKDDRRLVIIPQTSAADCATPSVSQYSTTEHWGQRKLLLTEIEFLTKYASTIPSLVVYAGAAPGWHIPYLSSLFPKLTFHLFDDKDLPFNPTDRIKIYRQKFTKDTAKQLYNEQHREVLFICNIRSNPESSRSNAEANRSTNELPDDMETQLRLHEILRPQYSLLYFRVSREHKKFFYPQGHLILEPWSSRRSTECRLVIKKEFKLIEYRSNDFIYSMNCFQNVKRTLYYEHEMDKCDSDGLDHCYDCRTEIYILEEYLTKIQNMKNDQTLYGSIAQMSRNISKHIVDKDRPTFLKVERTLGIIPKKRRSKF